MRATEARAALEAPTDEGLLALVSEWRASRAGVVATVLEQLGEALLERNPLGAPREAQAFQLAWLSRAKRPSALDVTWLAQTLTSHLPKSPKTQRADLRVPQRALRARLQALAKLEVDPRFSAAIATAVVECPFAFEHAAEVEELYGSGFVHLTADERQAEVLQRALEAPKARAGITRAALKLVLPGLRQACTKVRSRLPAAVEAEWRALTRVTDSEPRGPTDAEEALLQQVLAHDRDDRPRWVYADALSVRGEPRGEFISLQLGAGSSNAEALKRQRALLKQHQANWLGPLHRVLTHLVFHRGFLHEAALAHNAKAEPDVWTAAVSHPELRFLRRLGQGRGSAAAYLRFLDAPGCAGLTDVDVAAPEALQAVLRAPQRPFRSLTFHRAPSLELLRQLKAFPRLTRLVVQHVDDPQFSRNLESSGVLSQLVDLECGGTRFAASFLKFLGFGAVRRVTFTAFHSCVTVTGTPGQLVVEGEADVRALARGVLEAVEHASQVTLAVPRSVAAKKEDEWFEHWLKQHSTRSEFRMPQAIDGVGFHQRLRLGVVSSAQP